MEKCYCGKIVDRECIFRHGRWFCSSNCFESYLNSLPKHRLKLLCSNCQDIINGEEFWMNDCDLLFCSKECFIEWGSAEDYYEDYGRDYFLRGIEYDYVKNMSNFILERILRKKNRFQEEINVLEELQYLAKFNEYETVKLTSFINKPKHSHPTGLNKQKPYHS